MLTMTSQRRLCLLATFLAVWCCFVDTCHALVFTIPFQSRSKSHSLRSSSSSRLELIEPITNCTVVLCGCLHGSSSSSSDVRNLLSSNQDTDDVIVLELCASRFANLRRAQEQRRHHSTSASVGSIPNFLRMVSKTTQNRGWDTGVAAAILGGASGLQTALSGFEAGSEFITALEIANDQNYDIVLADRTVDETLRRVGSLPEVSWAMLMERDYQDEANALQTAVFGDSTLPSDQQISMPRVFLRNAAVRQDMVRLMLPTILLAQTITMMGQLILNIIGGGGIATGTSDPSTWLSVASSSAFASDFSSSSSFSILVSDMTSFPSINVSSLLLDVILNLLTSGCVLLLGYNLLALPATRVILCERDDPLADGIRAACRLAQQQQKSDSTRVVAVLGLLHVNGVAQRLLVGDGKTRY